MQSTCIKIGPFLRSKNTIQPKVCGTNIYSLCIQILLDHWRQRFSFWILKVSDFLKKDKKRILLVKFRNFKFLQNSKCEKMMPSCLPALLQQQASGPHIMYIFWTKVLVFHLRIKNIWNIPARFLQYFQIRGGPVVVRLWSGIGWFGESGLLGWSAWVVHQSHWKAKC